jgi:hypothetical protein
MSTVKSAKDKMPCNKPTKTPGEKKSWKVKACENGEEKIVRFGDPKMPDRSDEPERRKNFRARHNCDSPGSKLKARYWSCRAWIYLFAMLLPVELLKLAS